LTLDGTNVSGPGYRGLAVWHKAVDLAVQIHSVSLAFPEIERFILIPPFQRAANSISSNIAEGRGRGSKADYVRFLNIAHGSLCEVETQIELARRFGYLNDSKVDELSQACEEIGRMLRGLIKSQRPEN
jgi:four helix bundle protein